MRKGEFMSNQEINNLILRRELETGHTEQCLECRNTFYAYKDGCPICSSLRTRSIIDIGEIKTVEIPASEYFLKYGFILIRNEDGNCEFIFTGDSCTFPKEEKKE